jgi:hypothetical protein
MIRKEIEKQVFIHAHACVYNQIQYKVFSQVWNQIRVQIINQVYHQVRIPIKESFK